MNRNRVIGFIIHIIVISLIVCGYLYDMPILEYVAITYVLGMVSMMILLHIYAIFWALKTKIDFNRLSDHEKRELEEDLGYEIIEPINMINLALMNSDVREMYNQYNTWIITYMVFMQILLFTALFWTGWLWVSYIYFANMIINLILTQKYLTALSELDE